MTSLPNPIFTIGHSNHPIERFLDLLDLEHVTAVADVRSSPHSRLYGDFNRERLHRTLESRGIAYVFLGRELGARSNDPSCYENGVVQFRRLAETDLFRAGLERVLVGAQVHRLALLCAEKEPLDCHRTLLVARELVSLGAAVHHIHADGRLESHAECMDRLLARFKLQDTDLFRTREEVIADACSRQERRIAYVDKQARAANHLGVGRA